MKPKRLGRGLRGLINSTKDEETQGPPPRTGPPTPAPPARPPAPADGVGVNELLVDSILPNPYQPRTQFEAADLEDLQASIQEHGVLQPIVVRRSGTGFELIAGERRLRAVRALGHERVPALIREADEDDMQTLALVENLQRVDLNAIEKARALRAMMSNFGLTQQAVAERVGKARTSISNLVRLLDLPDEIQAMVSEGKLSGAQARAVLLVKGNKARLALARKAATEGMTVRRIERTAAALRESKPTAAGSKADADPYIRDLEERLRRALGTDCSIKTTGRGGRIEIRYHEAGELDRLLELFGAA